MPENLRTGRNIPEPEKRIIPGRRQTAPAETYLPDDDGYRKNLLRFTGSRVSHLPAALFSLSDLLYRRYAASDLCVICPEGLSFHHEELSYYEYRRMDGSSLILRPDDCEVWISSFGDRERPHTLYLSIELHPAKDWGRTQKNDVAGKAPEPGQFAPRTDALVLRMNKSMRARYYYTAQRFLKANRGKYVAPGLLPDTGRRLRVIVFDTEMERPYPIQFAGILLERGEEGWQETERLSTYIALPDGSRLSRDVRRVTGLEDTFLEHYGISEKEADEQIRTFLLKADLLCGHAVLADKEIMRTSFIRQQLRLPYCLRRHEMIDTQILLEANYGLSSAVSLEKAAELTGVRQEGDTFHDARTDADVTARIFTRLEPEFLEKFHTEPVVGDAMMHSPQQLQLLGRFAGKGKDRWQGHGTSEHYDRAGQKKRS